MDWWSTGVVHVTCTVDRQARHVTSEVCETDTKRLHCNLKIGHHKINCWAANYLTITSISPKIPPE